MPTIGSRPAPGNPLARRLWYAAVNALIVAWLLAAVVVLVARGAAAGSEWLVVHLMLLGGASTAVIVWSQHFADTLLRRGAPGGRALLGARLGVHTAGAVLVVVAVPAGAWAIVALGAVLVLLAVIAQVVSMARQSRVALPSRFAPLVRYYIVAGLFLVIGVTLGVLLARADVSGEARDRLTLAHIGFNVGGWIGVTVVGTVILLWPTVLHARILPTADAAARRALPTIAVGVLIVGAGCLLGVRLGVTAGLVVYLAGLVLVLVEAARQARQAPPATYAGWSMAASLAWFAGSVAALAVLVAVAPTWSDASGAVSALLVPFVVGFVAQLVVAALTYLIPVVAGGGPAASRVMNAELQRFGLFRVLVVNGALVLGLFPVAAPVRAILLGLAVAALLAFVALAVRALVLRGGAASRASERPASGGGAGARGGKASPPSLHAASGAGLAALGTLVLAVAVGVAVVSAPGVLTGDGDTAGGGGSAAGGPAAAAAVPATGHTTTVTMVMKSMRFSPATVRVPAGDRLVIKVTNHDPTVHDLTLATGVTSGRLAPGASGHLDAGVIRADVDGWCSVTGHRQLGMTMRIVAVGAASAGQGAMNGDMNMGSGAAGGAAKGPSAAKDIDLAKKPGKNFAARDASLPPASASTVHRLTLTVRDRVTEVAPGVFQTLWTYNGTAPGPTLRGKVGDTFDITLVNHGSMGHSIDFHAGSLAPDRPMRTIAPGHSLRYTFTATRSGIWLYHCSTMPMSLHIANGMYGAVIIDPPGLDHVDREYVLVQSEYYLGPQRGVADPARIATEKPDLVVFNGYADQYRDRPLVAMAGDRVRVWVLDAGPNAPSAFHIVGAQFDTVFEEGDYLLKNGGSTGTGGSQVLAMQPAEGGFVETTFPEAGNYPFVSHIMSDAERGASGVFHVTKPAVSAGGDASTSGR